MSKLNLPCPHPHPPIFRIFYKEYLKYYGLSEFGLNVYKDSKIQKHPIPFFNVVKISGYNQHFKEIVLPLSFEVMQTQGVWLNKNLMFDAHFQFNIST